MPSRSVQVTSRMCLKRFKRRLASRNTRAGLETGAEGCRHGETRAGIFFAWEPPHEFGCEFGRTAAMSSRMCVDAPGETGPPMRLICGLSRWL